MKLKLIGGAPKLILLSESDSMIVNEVVMMEEKEEVKMKMISCS